MGVLDIPSHRLLIREIAQNSVHHVEENQTEDEEELSSSNQRSRRQRTPKLGRKVYGSHDFKRGKGVRQKRRSENLFFLYSLADTLDLENVDDDDYADNHMTAFGELFIDPGKMQVWSQFMNMSEEQQRSYLQNMQHGKQQAKATETHNKVKNEDSDEIISNPNFERISKKIQDYLQSDKLSKESLREFEEDFVSTMTDFPLSVLVLNMPSSYERLLIHGLCQYMHLKAKTHKFKRKCLMEIENEKSSFEQPCPLLSDYLESINKDNR